MIVTLVVIKLITDKKNAPPVADESKTPKQNKISQKRPPFL